MQRTINYSFIFYFITNTGYLVNEITMNKKGLIKFKEKFGYVFDHDDAEILIRRRRIIYCISTALIILLWVFPTHSTGRTTANVSCCNFMQNEDLLCLVAINVIATRNLHVHALS